MVKIFQTKSGRIYAYHPLTNQIITLKTNKCIPISEEAIQNICGQLEREGTLDNSDFSSIVWRAPFNEYFLEVKGRIPSLLLEVTKRCNLYCDYCSVSGALSQTGIEQMDMTEEIMFSAIDFFREHNTCLDSAHISFYGGEALLSFELIQAGVQYVIKSMQGKKLSFDISTNGMTLTEDVAAWISSNPAVKITCTVNGPYHDKYRKCISGCGSLDIIMEHLNDIRRKYPQVWENQIRFIANLDSDRELSSLLEFYHFKIGRIPDLVTEIVWENGLSLEENLCNESMSCISAIDFSKNTFLSAYYAKRLWSIQHRPVVMNNRQAVITSCFPCEVKLFVHVNGTLGFCEKVCEKAVIGDLKTGFDKLALHRLYNDVQQLYHSQCLRCWAQRLCGICLCNLFDSSGILLKHIPDEICCKEKEKIMKDLSLYCQMAEEAPSLLNMI